MTDLSEKILQEYQVRKSKKQKDAFIALLQEHYPDLIVEQSGFIKSRNLILGDVSTANTVFSAHYDTSAKLPIPNFIAPKNVLVSLLYSLLLLLPMMLVLFLLNFPLNLLLPHDFWVHYVVTLITAGLLMSLMIAGPSNKHNANDNTSGVITLLEIYSRLTDEQKAQTAFVFFDNEEIGLLGSSQFKKKHEKEMEDKLLINFDCVADGDYFLLAVTKDADSLSFHGRKHLLHFLLFIVFFFDLSMGQLVWVQYHSAGFAVDIGDTTFIFLFQSISQSADCGNPHRTGQNCCVGIGRTIFGNEAQNLGFVQLDGFRGCQIIGSQDHRLFRIDTALHNTHQIVQNPL